MKACLDEANLFDDMKARPREVRRGSAIIETPNGHPYWPGDTIEVDGVLFDVEDAGSFWIQARPRKPVDQAEERVEPEPPRETHPQLVYARNLWESQHDMVGLRSLAIAEKYGRSHLWEKPDAMQG